MTPLLAFIVGMVVGAATLVTITFVMIIKDEINKHKRGRL